MGLLKLPTIFDRRVNTFTKLKDIEIMELMPDIVPSVYSTALFNRMPDFRQMSWDEVLTVRETPPAQEFRDMLVRVRSRVLQELPNLRSQDEVARHTMAVFSKELYKEMMQFVPKTNDIALDMTLNFVPVIGSALSTVRGAVSLIQSRQSWTSLLRVGPEGD